MSAALASRRVTSFAFILHNPLRYQILKSVRTILALMSGPIMIKVTYTLQILREKGHGKYFQSAGIRIELPEFHLTRAS